MVNPISDLRLVVIVAFAVVEYGKVGVVGHHLGIDIACRTRVFVEHDVWPADACAGRAGRFDQTIPALPFCVSYYELHDLVVPLYPHSVRPRGIPGGCVQVTLASRKHRRQWGHRSAP